MKRKRLLTGAAGTLVAAAAVHSVIQGSTEGSIPTACSTRSNSI
jgi:hypothetical protein